MLCFGQKIAIKQWQKHFAVVSCILCMLLNDVASDCEHVAGDYAKCSCKAGSFEFTLKHDKEKIKSNPM